MKTLSKILTAVALSSFVLFSCELEEDNPTPDGIIPAGMENKLVFTGVYDDMTTSFTNGILEVFDTTCTMDLYFIHHPTGDTLNFFMSFLPYNNGLPEGTYTYDENGSFNFVIAGDWTHGEFFPESGDLIIEKEGDVVMAVFDFDGFSHGSSGTNAATAKGYFKDEFIINYN